MRFDCRCEDCGGLFAWDDLENGETEVDEDGDVVFTTDDHRVNACPECGGHIEDL